MSFEAQKNLENNNPFNPSQNLEKSQKTQSALAGQVREDRRVRDMAPDEKKKVNEVESDIRNLMQHDDIIELNARLRDPSLKNFISDTLRRVINEWLRTANKEKIRGYINANNMGAVTDEMASQLHEVKGGYHEIFQRLDTELAQPEALTDDRETILALRDEVEEAELMVDTLLSQLSTIGQRMPERNSGLST